MKAKKSFVTLSAFALLSAHAAVPEISLTDDYLIGGWNCVTAAKEDELEISISSDEFFVRNGKINSTATMLLKISDEFPNLEYLVNSSGTWKADKNFLIITSADQKFINVSHPELDSILDFNDLFPNEASDSFEVVNQTEGSFSAISESDGSRLECIRKNSPKAHLNERYPLRVEYEIIDTCINSSSAPMSRTTRESKAEICLCALEHTSREFSYHAALKNDQDFLTRFEHNAAICKD